MTTPGDSWAAGEAYDSYMGRWSRTLAAAFLDWLAPAPGAHWLEVGCGTGSLTAEIVRRHPGSVLACDPSGPFIEHARHKLGTAARFQVIPPTGALPARPEGFDLVVSSLVLNFIPEPQSAVAVMRDRCRPGGTVAACVWDYRGGVEFLRHFWEAAVAVDPGAAALDESRRFESWQPGLLASTFADAGLADVTTGTLEIATDFTGFEDCWRPFTGGVGPAPAYVASLDPAQHARLRAELQRRLQPAGGGLIRLRARAFSVRGLA
jgi:SAM-dependent methyltransferase